MRIQEQQTVTFFNVIATPELGKKRDILKRKEYFYGQAKLTLNVNPLNGNLFIKDFTKTFCDQGVQFTIGYQYNSQSITPWTINQGKEISSIEGRANEVGSFVYVTEADGDESRYTYDAQRACYVSLSEAGGSSVLYYTGEQWSGWNPLSNNTELYNAHRQLQQITDKDGNYLLYEYDTCGRLITLHGISGLRVVFEYTSNRTDVYSIDADIKKLEMQYFFDENNRLIQTLIPLNINDNYEVNYSYEEGSVLISTITQSDCTEVGFTYIEKDDFSHLNSLCIGSQYTWFLSYKTNVTQLVDPLGNKEYFIREAGLLKKYSYLEQYQEYMYDTYDRLIQVTYQDNSAQHFSYDSLGCYATLVARDGAKTICTRDESSGLLLGETSALLQINGEQYLDTSYIFNDKKQLAFKIEAHGAVRAYGYDEFGNCIREITYLDAPFDINKVPFSLSLIQDWCDKQSLSARSLSEWRYNKYGKKISQTIYANIALDGSGIFDECAAYEEYEWTMYAQLYTKKTKLNAYEFATNQIEYDGLSRVIKESDALEQITHHVYQKNEQRTLFEPTQLVITKRWDICGLLEYQEEQCGEHTRNKYFNYDKKGRLYHIEQDDCGEQFIVYDEYNRVLYTIDGENRVIKNDYDLNNNLLHQTRFATPLTQLDEWALRAAKWQPTPAGDCCIESTFYNAIGQLLCSIDGDNYISEYCYDSLGNRIESISYAQPLNVTAEQRAVFQVPPDAIPTAKDRHQRFFYNEVNQLIGEQSSSGHVVIYQRNLNGELLNKITTLSLFPALSHWNAPYFLDALQKKQSFVLDARGQCLQQIDEELNVTHHSWDAGG